MLAFCAFVALGDGGARLEADTFFNSLPHLGNTSADKFWVALLWVSRVQFS